MNQPVIHMIDGPAGQIETASMLCDLTQPMPDKTLLLLHPHPLHGGTMGNKVVTTIARVARDNGLPAVAFNFRGAGRSAGVWDNGDGELADALHIVAMMAERGVSQLCLSGFSFGGSIAARLIQACRDQEIEIEVIDLLQVAPAVENFPVEIEQLGDVPRTVIYNADDEVVNPIVIKAYADAANAKIIAADTGGHFFHGELSRLKAVVASHYAEQGII